MKDLTQYVQPGFVGFTGEEITESLEFLWQLSSQADVSIEDHNHELSKKIFNVLVLLFDRAVKFNFLKDYIDEKGKQLTIQYDVEAVRDVLQLNEAIIDDYINRGLQNVRECFEFRHFIACFFNSARFEKRFEIMLVVLSACLALGIKQNTRCINMLCLRFKLSSRKQKYHWIWQQIECIDELNILSLRDHLLSLANEYYIENRDINHRNFNRNKTRINQLSNIITALDSALYFKQKGEHKKNFSHYYCHNHPDLFYDLLFDFYEIENSFVVDDLSIDEQKDDEFESDDDFQCIDSTEIDTQNGNLDDNHIVVTGVDTNKYPSESAQKNWSELAFLHHTKKQSYFACNTHVLSIDDYVQLTKTLQRVFTHSNDDKTRKLVAILLCGVLYGISIEQLVLDLSSNKMKSYIDINLNITERPESELSTEQISRQFLNDSMSFRVTIDNTLIKAINKRAKVSFNDIKLYLKALRQIHGLVYLSCRRLERTLSVVFKHLGFNELLLDFIANQNKNQKTAIFYGGYAINDIYHALNYAHEFLGIDFKIIKPHKKSDNNTRIGSQIALSYKYTESILNDLVYLVENTNCFVNRFNYYTLYMRFLIMLTTGMRPAGFNRLLLKHIDDSAQLFAITDKNNRSQANHRFIALCDFVKSQLDSYIAFIADIQMFDLNHLVSTSGDIDAHDYALAVQSSIQTPFQFIHATNNKLYFSTRPPELITDFTDKLGTQDNWPRHELRNFLSDESVNEAVINANFGHEAPFLESQHVFSSMTLNELKSATTDYQNNIIDLLAIQPISLKTLINKKHGANFQKHVLQPLSVQDQLTDTNHTKRKLTSNSTVLQREPPSNSKSWVHKGQQVSHIVDRCKTEWQQQHCFKNEQVIAYVAISLIVYSGIRSTAMLDGFFNQLADSTASDIPVGKRFITDTLVVYVNFNSKHYGNRIDGEEVKNSHALIIDNISRLWLLHLRNRAIDAKKFRELALNWHNHLLNQLIFLQDKDDNKLTLDDFIQNANYVTEQQPNVNVSVALSNCLSSKIDTCGLTERDFNRYCYEDAFVTKPSSNKSKTLKHILKSVNTEKNAILKSQVDFDKRVHKKILTAINLSNRASVIEALKQLKAQQSHVASQRLIAWLIYRLDDKHIKRIALSSLRTYFGYIGWRWLYFTEDLAVEHLSADDFDILYEDILSSTFDNSLAERAFCLYHFHYFQVAHCNAPQAQIPFFQNKIMVRAQLVSFDLYKCILAEINGRYNSHDALVLKLFFIMAYRTGMRKSEILGLRFSDFENIETENLNCIVRPHSARSIKTTSSKRRILLSVCLKADELKLLKDYLAFNIPSKNLNQIVFSSYVDDQMLGSHVPSQALSAILDDIYGQDVKHGISVHSFRHTAINNFALYFNGHDDLVSAFTDFSSADVNQLRIAYTGSIEIGQQGWFLVARIAGHLHPHMTFLHYIHLSTLIAGYQLSQSEALISAKMLENIAGISKQNLYDSGIHKTNAIKINTLNRLITRREFPNIRKHEDISLKIEKTKQRLLSTNKKTQQTLFDKYNFSNIKFALMYLQNHRGHSCHDASEQYNMSTEDIHQLYKKARTVAKQTTNKGMSRFYRKEVFESLKTHEEQLFPRDISAQDRKLLQPFFSYIDAGFPDNKEQIKQFLAVVAEKITTKRTWLNFSAKPKKLHEFLNVLNASFVIIPTDYILIYVPNADIKSQLEKYLNGRKVDIVVRDVNYIQLGVKHINYNTDHHKKTQNRHFSSVLRYIIQVLMIVMMD